MMKCENANNCPCTYPCPNHGHCCACVNYHRKRGGEIPACYFSKEAEASYDRSLENLARDRGILK